MAKCPECRAFVGHNKACSKYNPTACLQCEHPLLKGVHTCGKSPREPKQEKFMYGSENFPILFENNEVVIFKNPSNEIFIEGKKGGKMRMNFDDGIQFTSQGCRVDPFSTNGLIGWRVK